MNGKAKILGQFDLDESHFIGEGTEARVYALGDDRVLRICKGWTDISELKKLQLFYDNLDTTCVSFSVPKILEIQETSSGVYTIDTLIKGTDFSKKLPALESADRQQAWKNFYQTASQISLLAPQKYDYFGEILTKDPIRASTWPDYLRQKTQAMFSTTRADLITDVPNIDDIMAFFQKECSVVQDVTVAHLVHGDYYPPNTYITDDLQICGVGDFNDLSISGDQRLETMSSIFFLEALDYVTPDDIAFLTNLATQQYGADLPRLLQLYRLYYCFRFSNCKQRDNHTYQWCVKSLRSINLG